MTHSCFAPSSRIRRTDNTPPMTSSTAMRRMNIRMSASFSPVMFHLYVCWTFQASCSNILDSVDCTKTNATHQPQRGDFSKYSCFPMGTTSASNPLHGTPGIYVEARSTPSQVERASTARAILSSAQFLRLVFKNWGSSLRRSSTSFAKTFSTSIPQRSPYETPTSSI
jgi:hypothetical protein